MLGVANNAEGVFNEWHNEHEQVGGVSLEEAISVLFAGLQENSKLVCFDRIHSLGESIDEAKVQRTREGLEPTNNASFFQLEQKFLSPGFVSWSQKQVKVFVYTRVGKKLNFACSNFDSVNAFVEKNRLR